MTLSDVEARIATIQDRNLAGKYDSVHARVHELQADFVQWISESDAIFTSPSVIKSIAQRIFSIVVELGL